MQILKSEQEKFLVMGINSSVVIYSLKKADEARNYDLSEEMVEIIKQQHYVYKIKCEGNLILVADILKSLTVYSFEKRVSFGRDHYNLSLIARDPQRSWCLDMAKVGDLSYLMVDFH